MARPERFMNLDEGDRARLVQKRVRRPSIDDLPTAHGKMRQARQSRDFSILPDSYYDHLHDRVYIRLINPVTGEPLTTYRAEDMLEPNINNRRQRTVED